MVKLSGSRLKRLCFETALVLGLGVVAGFCNNGFSAKHIPLVGQWNRTYGVPSPGGTHAATYGNVEVGLDTAVRLFREGAVFLDARPAAGYAESHIAGAQSVPEESTGEELPRLLDALPANEKLVTYCQSMECDEAHLLAKALREAGCKEVYVFAGGLAEWKKAGEPLERGSGKIR
jgi:rhodanese-related sulfurtransferase